MPSRGNFLLLFLAAALRAQPGTYAISVPERESWRRVLESVNLTPAPAAQASLRVSNDDPGGDGLQILTGDSPAARRLGFQPTGKTVHARYVIDRHDPALKIIWREAVEVPVVAVPERADIFVTERWSGAPLVAGVRAGPRSFLWLATSPGPQGFERFPYLLQALVDLGVSLPYRSRGLWVFFDSSYRLRVDLDYFAARWRRAGIAALHVAGWHYVEPNSTQDDYLRRLIEACHRHGILVYAWLELPHVSEAFWTAHPEWREKTALLQDAHLDWRKLMNLANPDCAAATEQAVSGVLDRFDWDGVNLAELYFESPHGYSNAARFTPMNQDVRQEFRRKHGFDPLEAFRASSPRYHGRSTRAMRAFLDYRADLAFRLQTTWVDRLKRYRARKPHLDLVLTHVDDRLDSTMRDTIGADAPRTLAFAEKEGVGFLVEDPATVWDRGPQRYTDLATQYAKISRRPDLLSIDINIVERYQDVYPTRQQTGLELLQLVNFAARAFPQVALYFEGSLTAVDLPLLPAAAAVIQTSPSGLQAGPHTGIRRALPATVNGVLWPFQDEEVLWLPKGPVQIERADRPTPFRIRDFSGVILAGSWNGKRFQWAYESKARAVAFFDHPVRLSVDGTSLPGEADTVWLPPGKHTVDAEAATDK